MGRVAELGSLGHTTLTVNTSRISSLTFRAVLVFGCLAWGSYFLAMFRTSGFGLSFDDLREFLVAALVFVAPLAIFPFLGLGWRRIVIGVLAVCAGSFIIAEVFGRAQEIAVVRRYGPAPTEQVTVTRWWPFRHHSIFYVRDYGWSGCD